MGQDSDRAAQISAIWNEDRKNWITTAGAADQLAGGAKSRDPARVLDALDMCANTTNKGRGMIDAMLSRIIDRCGAARPDPNLALQREIALFQRAYDDAMAAHPADFRVDDTFGADMARWTVETHAPLVALPEAAQGAAGGD